MRRSPARAPSWQGWRQAVLAWSVAAILVLARGGDGGAGGSAAAPDEPAPPLVPFRIRINPGIYLLGELQPAAAYAVETPEGLVLIDSGLAGDASLVKSQLVALGLDWEHTRAILLTHAHADHTGGAEHLRGATGAKVYAGRGDADVLRAGGPREALFSAFDLPGGVLHKTRVDVELDGGEVLDFGGVRFRVLATPGHTPGSTCYLLERDGRRVLFSGDVISMLLGDETSHDRMQDPLGTYSAYLAPRYRGDARTYLRSLRQLRAMPLPDVVLPGHPRSDPAPQDPRISRGRWEAILDGGIADMATLQGRYEADGADFLDGIPKPLLPDLDYLGDLDGIAVYVLFARSGSILVHAPGGPGLLPFVRDRLRRLGRDPSLPASVVLTSGDPEETAGLRSLVEACHPQVFAPADGIARLERTCPAGTVILPAEALAARGGLDIVPFPLRGRGVAPIAYHVGWAGKTVLFSGRIPIKTNGHTDAALLAEIAKSRDMTLDYLGSVYRLAGVKPDLWLPSVPVDGQNAHLYDDEWPDILDDNYRIGYRSLMRRGGIGGEPR